MSERYVCIHGHFYQPPRENPWLEAIELQDSAYPYHDWNERITAECYGPNAAARILDDEGRIERIINNYARISFNVGPTLLAWLEARQPTVYEAILEADRLSQARFDGHGSAMAQAYHHLIMPLATPRDKRTQVRWGLRDFEHRFGRRPAGMWLPETAVDVESLELMAAHGIRFTVLEPGQARRVRPLSAETWHEVADVGLDPRRPYRCRLPSGDEIAIFFYDGPISRAVAFEDLLDSGERFAARLVGGFSEREGAQLVNIATDGETYGHHHRQGEMGLAYALHHLEAEGLAEVTNYAAYLAAYPPQHEVEIWENTAWSCAHGVERWQSDCGCHTGGQPGWHQRWRAPLRAALDWLRDTLAPRYEAAADALLVDPWAARDDYITVILDRSPETLAAFLDRHAVRTLTQTERTRTLELLELQRHAMLMYTSCGWFFNELSGIETVQVLQYAGRALQLAEQLFDADLEPDFLERLAQAESNVPAHRNGRVVFEKFVRPAQLDLAQVGAHYALSSIFEDYPERTAIYCYLTEREDERSFRTGRARLRVGKVRVTSQVTRQSELLSFGVLYFGDQNLSGGVRRFRNATAYAALIEESGAAFERGDFAAVIRVLDKYFSELTYSLKSLFRDEQRKVLDVILEETLSDIEAQYRHLYEHHAALMSFVDRLGMPLPPAFRATAEIVLNRELREAFEQGTFDVERVQRMMDETATWGLELDTAGIGFALSTAIEEIAEGCHAHPHDLARLERFDDAVRLAHVLPFPVDLWEAQNTFYDMLAAALPAKQAAAEGGDAAAAAWLAAVRTLAAALNMRVPDAEAAMPAASS